MTNPIEAGMYGISQWFLYPVLIAIAILFAYAFLALGGFFWQLWQRSGARRNGTLAGHELLQAHRDAPTLIQDELEAVSSPPLDVYKRQIGCRAHGVYSPPRSAPASMILSPPY